MTLGGKFLEVLLDGGVGEAVPGTTDLAGQIVGGDAVEHVVSRGEGTAVGSFIDEDIG